MAITLVKRPNDRCWSGNPVHYHLYSADALADDSIFFEVKLFFKRNDAAVFEEVITLPYTPSSGAALINLQDVLDGLLEYEMPTVPGSQEYATPYFSTKVTGKFYIGWREITAADPDPAWITTESDHERFVIKGGISFPKWRGDNYWVNYFDIALPFLTWQKSGRLAGTTERMYLAWLNLSYLSAAYIKMRRKLVFTDGTQHLDDMDCPASYGQVVFFPCGAAQLELSDVDPNRSIHYWELQVWNTNDQLPLSESFRFYLDNRNSYSSITLNYRNSLGGLDSVRVRGVVEKYLERSFTNQQQLVTHNYFEGSVIKPRITPGNSRETLVYKGDIGFVSREEQDRLRDIHYQRECWWEQQRKWIPVLVSTGSISLSRTSDNLWSMPVEFSIAHGGDNYYTPDGVDLADGTIPAVLQCNAIISALTVEEPGGGWLVSWNLVSGDPAKYQISTPGVSGGAPAETVTTSYLFPWLPSGDNVITVRPLCLIAGEYHYGAPQTIVIAIASACVPVGPVAGDLPDGVVDQAYNHSILLTGSQPFNLTDIVKPAWMSIVISGSSIQFTGTPAVSDVTEGDLVSFTITNCSGNNSRAYAGSVVVAEPQPGILILNESAGFQIADISPAFYLIDDGSLPVASGEQASGIHSGTGSAISITITGAGAASTLTISKNGSLVQSLPVNAAGVFNFAAHAYTASDIIEIKLAEA